MTPRTFVVVLVFAFCLLPLPAPALPTTHMLAPLQGSNYPTRIGADLIFTVSFALALLFALLGKFFWFATGRTIAQLIAGLKRICSTCIAFIWRLSDLRFASLLENAAAAIRDATVVNTANTPRRGGPSNPVATIPRRWEQRGGPRRFEGAQGSGRPSEFTPSP